jgi:hypothetical protein
MSMPDTPKRRIGDLLPSSDAVAVATTALMQGATAVAVEARRIQAISAPTAAKHPRFLTEERDHPQRHGIVAFPERTNSMNSKALVKPDMLVSERWDGVSPTTLAATGELEIAGRRYVTAARLAATLGVTVRTLSRWDAARIGPPKIKVGKLVLFDLAKLPEWLASRETEPAHIAGRRR